MKTFTFNAILALLIFIPFSSAFAQNVNDLQEPRFKDRVHFNLLAGSPTYVKLNENINNPFNFIGGLEVSYYEQFGGRLQFATGLTYTKQFSMMNGQFNEAAGGHQFLKANSAFTENHYSFSELSIPLVLRHSFKHAESNNTQFIGFGIRTAYRLSSTHKYDFEGERFSTDINRHLSTFKSSLILSFGQFATIKSRSTLFNMFEGEIGYDMHKFDNSGTRALTFIFKIGI